MFSSGADFPTEGLSAISSTTGARVTEEDFVEDVTLGVFAQEQIAWRDRVFLTAALRADDNSAFGENFDRVYYPKAGMSWVASDEPFFRAGWMNTLRFRAAYGEAGKQPSAFDALRTYVPATGPGDAPAVSRRASATPTSAPSAAGRSSWASTPGSSTTASRSRSRTTTSALWTRSSRVSSRRQAVIPGCSSSTQREIRNSGIEILTRLTPLRARAMGVGRVAHPRHQRQQGSEPRRSGPRVRCRRRVSGAPGRLPGRLMVREARDERGHGCRTGAVSNVRCDDGRRRQ